MPFTKGDEKTKEWARMGARKPYGLEQEQLERMRKIVSKDLDLLEKVYAGTATEEDLKILPLVKERVNKYLDKLHASKNTLQGENGEPFILQVVNYGKDYTSTTPIQPQNISVRVPTSTSTLQGGSVEQTQWQVQDSTKRSD